MLKPNTVHRPPAVLLGSGQQDDRGDAEERDCLPCVQMEDNRTTDGHLPHLTDHAEWVFVSAARSFCETCTCFASVMAVLLCSAAAEDRTDLDPAVIATLKKLQDGYYGGARWIYV